MSGRTCIRTGFALVAALLCLVAPAHGQIAEAIGDPEAVIAEELVVRARIPGPAWWRAEDADSTVWILGAPGALPRGVTWDAQPLRLRLEDADALLTPVTGRLSALSVFGFVFRNSDTLRAEQPLEERLAEPTRSRFIAAREALGKPASRYARWRPDIAGLLLSGDFYDTLNIETDEPIDTVRAAARRARVPVRKGASYDMTPVLREFAALDETEQLVCLEAALSLVEAGQGRVRSAAQGWAEGDVARAVSGERGFDRCLGALPTASSWSRRALADTTTTIMDALKKPGVSVMVVGLRSLVARDGVITRLRAQGVTVRTPAE
jgi:uncharacterized protein YbaP (TraB family)